MVDETGKPIQGAYLHPYHFEEDTKCQAVGTGAPVPPGTFQSPNPIPEGWTRVDVKLPNGTILISNPFLVKSDEPIKLRISGGVLMAGDAPVDPDVPVGPIDPATLAKHFSTGTFTFSISYYGGMSAPLPTFDSDMKWLASKGFRNIRVWPDFIKLEDRCRTFNRDGSTRPEMLAKLVKMVAIANSYGISVDVTLQCDGYDFVKRSEEGYDITAHKKVVSTLATTFKGNPGVSNIDVANEGGQRGPGGNGSPKWGHISPGRYSEIQDQNPGAPLTFSVDGDATRISDEYNLNLERGNKFKFLAPHFPRTSSAPKNEGAFVKELRSKLSASGKSIPIYNQEPFRRGIAGDSNAGPWKASDFIDAANNARSAGSVGFCLHNGHWNFEQKSLQEQLDSEEMGFVNWVATQVR